MSSLLLLNNKSLKKKKFKPEGKLLNVPKLMGKILQGQEA